MKKLILIGIGAALVCAIAGCGETCTQPATAISRETQVFVGCQLVSIKTVRHDGHDYIVSTALHGVGTVHSPDCPCAKKERADD